MEDRGESRNLDDFAAVNREVWQNFPRKTVRTSNKMEVKIHKFVRQLNISYDAITAYVTRMWRPP